MDPPTLDRDIGPDVREGIDKGAGYAHKDYFFTRGVAGEPMVKYSALGEFRFYDFIKIT